MLKQLNIAEKRIFEKAASFYRFYGSFLFSRLQFRDAADFFFVNFSANYGPKTFPALLLYNFLHAKIFFGGLFYPAWISLAPSRSNAS